jgi:aryl-alcohol dehydrogenase-like predicted oxidoreductase
MEYRPFGSSGLQASRLGLGLAALGRPGYITLGHADDLERDYAVEAMQAHSHQVLDEAWALGVRYFDAARSYGRAEEFLGAWLRLKNLPKEQVVVGSKWGYTYTADWQVQAKKHEIKDHSLPVLEHQWADTQANLNGYLNLYQIHSATLESGVLENAPVLNRLAQFKQRGVLIGLSLSGANQSEVLERAMQVQIDGQRLFDSVQATWNLLEMSAGGMLATAHEAGMVVILKEVVANGRLTERNTAPEFAPKRDLLQTQAARLGTSLDALAIAAALARPWADIVLSGAATVEQLRSNVQAVHVVWDEEAEVTLQSLAEPAPDYWQTRSRLDWN